MVEIIPYTEDDEDQSNWIPLTPATTLNNGAGLATNNSGTAAADDASAVSAVRKNVVNSRDSNSTNNAGHREDLVCVEDVEESDEDNEWEKLSSQSSHELPHNPTTTPQSNASSGAEPSWSWGKQFITHLTSTTTTATTSSATDLEDDDVSESEENIVWRRADDLEDSEPTHISKNRQSSIIEEEYEKISDSTFAKSNFTQEKIQEPPGTKPQRMAPPEQSIFQTIPTQQQNNHDQAQHNPSVKTKLQQKLIHDPLCALPLCFLRHLYQETKLEFTSAWDAYLEQNELQNILAPLTLFILVALLGVAFIGTGLFGLGNLILHASVQIVSSFCALMVEYVWTMANGLVWVSIGASSFLLGAIAWFRMRTELTRKIFRTPSISTFIPWAVAFTSPSLYETFVIILSLRVYVSILTQRNHVEECLSSLGDDEDPSCHADGMYLSSSLSTLAACVGALLVAAMNAVVVSVAANLLEQNGNHRGYVDGVSNGKGDARSSTSSESAENATPSHTCTARYLLRERLDQIQRHICTCHTVSVLSFAVLSVISLIIEILYTHYLKESERILFSLANGMGAVGCNLLCIGLGGCVVAALWNFTIASITGNDAVLARRISYGEISRNALKKSIVEISSNAVWSEGDTGSGLLGILSDDDGALRIAVLEWAIDRWTMSPTPAEQDAATTSVPTQSSSDDVSTPAANDNDMNTSSDGDHSNSNSFQSNSADSYSNNVHGHRENKQSSNNTDNHQPILESLQNVIAKLDADEALIPTIARYRAWVYSLPPSQNAAVCVALWKMCPAGMTVLWCVGWYAMRRLFFCLSWRVGASSSQIASIMCTIVTIMSPLLFLEYQRVRQWLKNNEGALQSSKEPLHRDLIMLLLRGDEEDSSLLLRIWLLLLESIAILESSIPVVRLATVACAAADLTKDTICLVDLALEVKKRGFIGGVGMMIWDAFHYHLSMEIKERKQETFAASLDQACERQAEEHEELGGQYTGAVVSSVVNFGKLHHNITRLREPKSDLENERSDNSSDVGYDEAKSNENACTKQPTHVHDDENSSSGNHSDTRQSTNEHIEVKKMNMSSQSDRPSANAKKVIPIPSNDNQGDHTSDQGKRNLSQDNIEHEQDDNGLMPFLVGGGLAIAGIVGAVAGISLHAAKQSDDQHNNRREKSPKEST